MNDSRRAGLVLTGALALAVLVAGVSAVHWAARYRLGTSWDESDYVNQMVRLDQDAHARGLSHAVRQVRWTDNIRPPAYRLAALPVTYLLGADPRVLRALSLAALLLTGGLVYGAARLVSARPVAGVASASLVLSYAPLWASAHFGTEYVIYPATAGVIYGLMWWASGPRGRGGVLPWVGVVAALALGGLSKTSFAPLVAPAYLVFLAAGRRAGVPARVLWAAAGAAVAAALLIAPWWIVNAGSALAYARYASGFVRHDFPWLSEAFWHLLGPPVTVLGLGLLGFVAARWRAVRGAMVSGSMLALVMCLVGAVSLLVVHALGANHNMRLASPALIPLALAGAVLAQASAAFEDRRARVAVGLLVLLQGGYVAREFSRARIEQWDWSALRSLCAQRGLRYPDIRYLGERHRVQSGRHRVRLGGPGRLRAREVDVEVRGGAHRLGPHCGVGGLGRRRRDGAGVPWGRARERPAGQPAQR